ncbi:MAG: hypothetical protein HC909_03715, partial [Blastochloris sp.]|nr:hypothetical protein [Blastochloris sp.]
CSVKLWKKKYLVIGGFIAVLGLASVFVLRYRGSEMVQQTVSLSEIGFQSIEQADGQAEALPEIVPLPTTDTDDQWEEVRALIRDNEQFAQVAKDADELQSKVEDLVVYITFPTWERYLDLQRPDCRTINPDWLQMASPVAQTTDGLEALKVVNKMLMEQIHPDQSTNMIQGLSIFDIESRLRTCCPKRTSSPCRLIVCVVREAFR